MLSVINVPNCRARALFGLCQIIFMSRLLRPWISASHSKGPLQAAELVCGTGILRCRSERHREGDCHPERSEGSNQRQNESLPSLETSSETSSHYGIICPRSP